jgi:hypothetical protein
MISRRSLLLRRNRTLEVYQLLQVSRMSTGVTHPVRELTRCCDFQSGCACHDGLSFLPQPWCLLQIFHSGFFAANSGKTVRTKVAAAETAFIAALAVSPLAWAGVVGGFRDLQDFEANGIRQ